MKRFRSQTSPLPLNATLSKGSVHVAAQRGFVDYALHKSQTFLEWLRKTFIPDETFFCTLNKSTQLGIPGAYTGKYCIGRLQIICA